MKKNKIIGLIFGGKSAEHDVSIMSARYIRDALLQNDFTIVLIGIDKNGCWRFVNNEQFDGIYNQEIQLSALRQIVPIPQSNGNFLIFDKLVPNKLSKVKIDIAFPILHGPMGEDGAIQGILKILDVPFVGSDILGSAVSMDKVCMKKLLREANIPIADFLYFYKSQQKNINYQEIMDYLRLPFFVKPANMGSSIGISKVSSQDEFLKAIEVAFKYDNKIIIEKYIAGREIECSVIGDYIVAQASMPGEVILSKNEFYSYDEKYKSDSQAVIDIPAKLASNIIVDIKNISIMVFKALNCYGMGRVDFFLNQDNKLFVNEINTIPGFTKISMYPKLWEISGINAKDLVYKLVDLAERRFKDQNSLNFFI